MDKPFNKQVVSAASAISVWLALLFSAPTAEDYGLEVVPQSTVLVYPAAPYDLARRPESTSHSTRLSDLQLEDFDGPAQYHLESLAERPALQDHFVFVPVLSGTARLLINGVPKARSAVSAYSGAGFGSAFLLSPIGTNVRSAGKNRVDFIVSEGSSGLAIREIYYGPLSRFESFENHYSLWVAALKGMGLLAGLSGLLAGMAGIALGQNRPFSLGGLLLAGGAFLHGANGNIVLYSKLATLTATFLLVAGSAIAVWQLREPPTFQGAVIRGLAVAALGTSILALVLAGGGSVAFDSFTSAHLAALGFVPALLIGIPLSMVGDLRHILARLSAARSDVAARDLIIAQQEEELLAQTRRRAVMEERQRFVRDMHDGVGGQLLSLLMRVRGKRVGLEQIEQEIEGGITDLRLVVDSLDQVGANLTAALATFRTRAQQQLDAAGISLLWSSYGEVNEGRYDAREILGIYRIMQEALTNSVRHAKPSIVSIQIDGGADHINIAIADNGTGFDIETTRRGRGISNMEERAEKLGAKLAIAPALVGTGTIVRISLASETQGSA